MKITIRNFQKKIPISPRRIKKAILKVLSSEGIKKPIEVNVSFVTDKKIKALNKRFLSKNSATDVLSFNLSSFGDKKVLADIVISADTALRNAKIFKTNLAAELSRYAVHGMLHIIGYTDHNPKQRKLMRKKEDKYVYP